jgi:hypothetical protein
VAARGTRRRRRRRRSPPWLSQLNVLAALQGGERWSGGRRSLLSFRSKGTSFFHGRPLVHYPADRQYAACPSSSPGALASLGTPPSTPTAAAKALHPPRSGESTDHAGPHPSPRASHGVRGRRRRGGEQAAARGWHVAQPERCSLPGP